jgi:hypothetical protein
MKNINLNIVYYLLAFILFSYLYDLKSASIISLILFTLWNFTNFASIVYTYRLGVKCFIKEKSLSIISVIVNIILILYLFDYNTNIRIFIYSLLIVIIATCIRKYNNTR